MARSRTGALSRLGRDWGSKARKREEAQHNLNQHARRQVIAEGLADTGWPLIGTLEAVFDPDVGGLALTIPGALVAHQHDVTSALRVSFDSDGLVVGIHISHLATFSDGGALRDTAGLQVASIVAQLQHQWSHDGLARTRTFRIDSE